MPDQKTNPNLKLTLTVRNPPILIRQEKNKRYLTIPVVCGCGIGAIHLVRKISAIFNRPSALPPLHVRPPLPFVRSCTVRI